jgi:1-deoxy-D-xylulose-5-phosphate synthase
VKRIGIPDELVDHATPEESKVSLGLTSEQIVNDILQAFFKKEVDLGQRFSRNFQK